MLVHLTHITQIGVGSDYNRRLLFYICIGCTRNRCICQQLFLFSPAQGRTVSFFSSDFRFRSTIDK
ncbi:hypothetical protein PTKIN_Ptkin03bG0088500 [Pterospermum kingtungense]